MKGERDYAKNLCCISYMVLQLLAGAMARYYMHVYVCKCGFVTFLDVMLRTPLANERSTKSDSSDFGYEFVTVRSGNTTNEFYLAFS